MKNKRFKLLDHGFIELTECLGSDQTIVDAARISTGSVPNPAKQSSTNEQLINYLYRHRHTSPFEHVQLQFRVKAPLFVTRQWMRHRTGSFNEMSARYSVLPNEFYIPEKYMIKNQSTANNQGGTHEENEFSENYLESMEAFVEWAYEAYTTALISGISRELARLFLPVNVYTEFVWSVNLHNLFHFCKLRSDSHAQYEIQVYASKIEQILADIVPLAYKAYENYNKFALQVSETEQQAIMFKHTEEDFKTKREWKEFNSKLKLLTPEKGPQ